jgi:hypothetical protein
MVESDHYRMFPFSVRLEIPSSYERPSSITVFTKIHHLALCAASLIISCWIHFLKYTVILSCNVFVFSLEILQQIICKHFLISPYMLPIFQPDSSWSNAIPKWDGGYKLQLSSICNLLQSFITLSVEMPSSVLHSEMLYLVRFVDKMCYWPSYPLQTLISLVL